ncbi:hypothetical protein JMJ77_0013468 [Colletotrichum scovillei]|uniref:Uncharacterized protein n=1 Tax=Colletotrichum scovillei TaxID=1209932 RepID=A0A9P7R5R8_9PEZI|nr:hypothetical protein JMJ77_0013468 [Colletotrichum scovillei]KAG7069769.1 hypothetical protein JMJ76_0003432 [Colletotrichum scovillei]KAG7073775.1 hypothetical protein JMJ78_0014742 [Colletotrichum scovillei]
MRANAFDLSSTTSASLRGKPAHQTSDSLLALSLPTPGVRADEEATTT